MVDSYEEEFAERMKKREAFKKLTLTETNWVEQPLPKIPQEISRLVGLSEIPCPLCGVQIVTSGAKTKIQRVVDVTCTECKGSGEKVHTDRLPRAVSDCRCVRRVETPREMGGLIPLMEKGEATGIERTKSEIRCPCTVFRLFWKEFIRTVPLHDQFIKIEELKASNKCRLPIEQQEANLALVKRNLDSSFLMFGPAGTGKTTLTIALYRKAVANWAHRSWLNYLNNVKPLPQSVWRVSAKTLLDQFHSYAISRERVDQEGNTKPVPAPEVNREKIVAAAQAGLKPRLFLEEIDKIKPTRFRLDSLFEVIDAIYENNGQIVINTNMTQEQLAEFFGDTDERGPVFIRRITDEGGVVINMY